MYITHPLLLFFQFEHDRAIDIQLHAMEKTLEALEQLFK